MMRIAEAAFDFGAEVAMTSQKHRSGTDRVAEVAAQLRGFTHVINVQGDEPLVDPTLITRLAATLAEDRKIEMITAAIAFEPEEDVANPNVVKVVLDRDCDALYFSRSPIPFVRDRRRATHLLPAPGHLRLHDASSSSSSCSGSRARSSRPSRSSNSARWRTAPASAWC